MERDEFVLHYQPVYDLRTGRVTGAEALIRWEHPEQCLMAPGRFVPTAEATGVIGPMGDGTLAAAAERAAGWRQLAWSPPGSAWRSPGPSWRPTRARSSRKSATCDAWGSGSPSMTSVPVSAHSLGCGHCRSTC